MDKFNLKEYLKNNPLLKEETLVDTLMDKVKGMSSNEFKALASKAGDLEIWKSGGDIDGINNVDDRLETISQGFNNDDAKRYLDIIKENKTLKENDDYKIELLVKTVYYDGDSGELYADKNTYYTDSELEDGADQTSYTSGGDLDDMIFSNDYDTAKEFEEDYPGLFKVV